MARQNLRNSKFSPDAKLVSFYEGIAQGLESRQAANDTFRLRRLRFEEAVDLIYAKDVNARVIGLEALCNLATIKQTKALAIWRFGPPQISPLKTPPHSPQISQDAGVSSDLPQVSVDMKLLQDAIENYQSLIDLLESSTIFSDREHADHASLTISRLELTARSGLILCRYAQWRESPSEEVAASIRFMATTILAKAEEVGISLDSDNAAQQDALNPFGGLKEKVLNRSEYSPPLSEQIRAAFNPDLVSEKRPKATERSDAAATSIILGEIVYFVVAIRDFVTLRATTNELPNLDES